MTSLKQEFDKEIAKWNKRKLYGVVSSLKKLKGLVAEHQKTHVVVPRKQLEKAEKEYNNLRSFAAERYPKGRCKHLLELFKLLAEEDK